MANGIYLIIIFHGFELSSECYQFQSGKNSLADIQQSTPYIVAAYKKKSFVLTVFSPASKRKVHI